MQLFPLQRRQIVPASRTERQSDRGRTLERNLLARHGTEDFDVVDVEV